VSASRMLLLGSVQSQAKGDLVLIEAAGDGEPKVTAISAGEHYATGKKGTYSAIDSFLYTRPIAYYAVIVAALGALSIALYFLMKRWRARRRGEK
jgi:hypothetical protein